MTRPFVKWAGGKGQLLTELQSRMPQEYGAYYEPMVGGGALFFSLRPANATLVDANFDLMRLYRIIRDSPDALIEDLQTHQNTKQYFDELRMEDRTPSYDSWSDVRKASRTLFLNRTCFNGLYRVNKSGQFNVPYGKYVNPYIPTADHLRDCSAALQGCTITYNSFGWIESMVEEGDFVYFDPPYLPLSDTAKFTEYTRNGFGLMEHEALRDLCTRLDARGVRFMLSNACTEATLALYAAWNVEQVAATRSISASPVGRAPVQEIIVRNYV